MMAWVRRDFDAKAVEAVVMVQLSLELRYKDGDGQGCCLLKTAGKIRQRSTVVG